MHEMTRFAGAIMAAFLIAWAIKVMFGSVKASVWSGVLTFVLAMVAIALTPVGI